MSSSRILCGLGLAILLTGCLGSAPMPGSPMPGPDGGVSGPDGGGRPAQGDMGGTNDDGSAPPPADGGAVGTLLCEATLSLSGTYTQGKAPPADHEEGSCWPDGAWTFTATVVDNNCQSAPKLESQFRFQVVEDDDFNDTITYLNDPGNLYVTTKISGGDGAICIGAFLIFSADGKTVINLRPALQADNSLNGQGDYRVYDADQRD